MRVRANTLVIAPLLSLGMLLPAGPACATLITLLDENFNDVSGPPDAGMVRTVEDILAINPEQLASVFTPPQDVLSVGSSPNVRRESNPINTSGGSLGFHDFFTSKFLVLGDDGGQIGGDPGAPGGPGGDTGVRFHFDVPDNATRIRISYDFAFNGVDTSTANMDQLLVRFTNGGTPVPVQTLNSPVDFGGDHIASFFDVFVDLDPGSYVLQFRLNETGGQTNTAAGIDNILIRAEIPEPETALLLAAGLGALAGIRRRRPIPGSRRPG